MLNKCQGKVKVLLSNFKKHLLSTCCGQRPEVTQHRHSVPGSQALPELVSLMPWSCTLMLYIAWSCICSLFHIKKIKHLKIIGNTVYAALWSEFFT